MQAPPSGVTSSRSIPAATPYNGPSAERVLSCLVSGWCNAAPQTTANRQSKRAHRENKDFRQVVESERADVARVVAGLVTAAESVVGSLVHVEAGSCREV